MVQQLHTWTWVSFWNWYLSLSLSPINVAPLSNYADDILFYKLEIILKLFPVLEFNKIIIFKFTFRMLYWSYVIVCVNILWNKLFILIEINAFISPPQGTIIYTKSTTLFTGACALKRVQFRPAHVALHIECTTIRARVNTYKRTHKCCSYTALTVVTV